MKEQDLLSIRDDIQKNIGKRVWLKANRGRSKCLINEGILESSFNSVFTVAVHENGHPQRLSYTYGDILTKNLEIKLLD